MYVNHLTMLFDKPMAAACKRKWQLEGTLGRSQMEKAELASRLFLIRCVGVYSAASRMTSPL
jgi:hypothetical protein